MILLLAQAYTGPDTEVIYSAHGFLMYPIAARAAGAVPVAAPEVNDTTSVEAILDSVTARTRMVFIANPNNPTGTYLPLTALRALRERLRDDVLLVIDSAYAEYSRAADYSPASELVDHAENTVMTRTFSKFFGLAGLRLGWAYCPPAIADVLNRIRGPFNVALPTQAAAIAVLEDEAFARASRPTTTAGCRGSRPSFAPSASPSCRAMPISCSCGFRPIRSTTRTQPTPSSTSRASFRERWAPTVCRIVCASPSEPRRSCGRPWMRSRRS